MVTQRLANGLLEEFGSFAKVPECNTSRTHCVTPLSTTVLTPPRHNTHSMAWRCGRPPNRHSKHAAPRHHCWPRVAGCGSHGATRLAPVPSQCSRRHWFCAHVGSPPRVRSCTRVHGLTHLALCHCSVTLLVTCCVCHNEGHVKLPSQAMYPSQLSGAKAYVHSDTHARVVAVLFT